MPVSWRCNLWDHSQLLMKMKTYSWILRRFSTQMSSLPWRAFLPLELVPDKSLVRSQHPCWVNLSIVRWSGRRARRTWSKMNLKSGNTNQASGIKVAGICILSCLPSLSSTTSSNAIVDNSSMRPYNNTRMSKPEISTGIVRAGRSNAINKSKQMREGVLR